VKRSSEREWDPTPRRASFTGHLRNRGRVFGNPMGDRRLALKYTIAARANAHGALLNQVVGLSGQSGCLGDLSECPLAFRLSCRWCTQVVSLGR
jgi:hypothetical protein